MCTVVSVTVYSMPTKAIRAANLWASVAKKPCQCKRQSSNPLQELASLIQRQHPSTTDIDMLEKDLAIIAATVKTSIFEGGEFHGHLSNVISNES